MARPEPAPVPTHSVHTFEPSTDEPKHVRDVKPFHAAFCKVMETLGEPSDPYFQYMPGMYVYVHAHAYNTNPLDAEESLIVNTDGAPLEIVVQPCNHPERTHTVRQDQLSAPIWV